MTCIQSKNCGALLRLLNLPQSGQIDPFGLLNVVPNSNPLGIKHFVPGIAMLFKCECYIIMQIQYTKNPNPRRFELGTTLNKPNGSIAVTLGNLKS